MGRAAAVEHAAGRGPVVGPAAPPAIALRRERGGTAIGAGITADHRSGTAAVSGARLRRLRPGAAHAYAARCERRGAAAPAVAAAGRGRAARSTVATIRHARRHRRYGPRPSWPKFRCAEPVRSAEPARGVVPAVVPATLARPTRRTGPIWRAAIPVGFRRPTAMGPTAASAHAAGPGRREPAACRANSASDRQSASFQSATHDVNTRRQAPATVAREGGGRSLIPQWREQCPLQIPRPRAQPRRTGNRRTFSSLLGYLEI